MIKKVLFFFIYLLFAIPFLDIYSNPEQYSVDVEPTQDEQDSVSQHPFYSNLSLVSHGQSSSLNINNGTTSIEAEELIARTLRIQYSHPSTE